MNGAQVAGWLRHLADQVQADDKLANRTLRAGPIQVVVPNPSTVRSWKSRHGSLEPPSVAQASHDLVKEVIQDALATRDAALLQRIRDAVAAEVSKLADHAISSLDLKNTTTSEPDRLSRARSSPAVVVAGGTESGGYARTDADISCPSQLRLTEEQIRNLEMNKGVPARFVTNITTAFVGKYMGDPTDKRTEGVWRKCLHTAVLSTWDSDRRKDYLHAEPDEAEQIAREAEHQRMLEESERLAQEERKRRREASMGPRKTSEPPPAGGQSEALQSLLGGIG